MENDTAAVNHILDDESEEVDEKDDPLTSHTDSGLKLLEIIGKGAYGTVYRAIWHGQLIAAKVIEHDESVGEGNDLITIGDSFCPFERGDTVGGAMPQSSTWMIRVPWGQDDSGGFQPVLMLHDFMIAFL
jgi:hypothetical protein